MKIESAVAVAALEAAIKKVGGVALVAKTLPIKMAIELGHFLIESDFFGQVDAYDGTGAVDEFMFEFFKTLTDNPSVAEDAVWEFNKAIADVPGVTDIDVLHFYKSLADVATFSDAHATDFSKALTSDITALGDHAYAYVKKVKEDLASIVDTEATQFFKALTEAPSLVDAIDTLAFFKSTQDAAGFSDVETLAFAKVLFDNVGVTDDIDGSASILDDQEMQYFKFTTDIPHLTDTFVRVVAFIREYTDSADLSDVTVWGVGKSLEDTTIFTDLRHKDFGKLLTENLILSDALSIQLTLAPFVSTIGASDVQSLVPGKIFTHEASLADTGSLRSQGYSDFSYFAEDYVGASRTF